jgi:hypothetical protein
MCKLFSFCTYPAKGLEKYYFDWEYRKQNLDDDGVDSHSHICHFYNLPEDKCNKYEYNPLTGDFEIDMLNDPEENTERIETWVRGLDFKKIAEPLIVKPIINPFELPKVEQITAEHIQLLSDWSSVWDSVGASVWVSVGDLVRDSVVGSVGASVRHLVWDLVRDLVWDSVGDLVWDSVEDLVWDSVGDLVWAYTSSFINTDYRYDFTPAIKLWEAGLVPSFDGTTWRLHSGVKAEVVYECKQEDLVR